MPFNGMHHLPNPPDGYGYWHGGWHDGWPFAAALLPLLFLLPLLVMLAMLLWSSRYAIGDWLGVRFPTSTRPAGGSPAVETLRQRYARGEIDRDTYQATLDDLRASEQRPDYNYNYDGPYDDGAVSESTADPDAESQAYTFKPRPDAPVDWS